MKERRNNYAQGRIDFRRVVSEGGGNSAKLPLVDVHDSVMQAIGLGNGRLAVKPVPHQQEGDIPDIMHRVEPETYAKRYRKRMWSMLCKEMGSGADPGCLGRRQLFLV